MKLFQLETNEKIMMNMNKSLGIELRMSSSFFHFSKAASAAPFIELPAIKVKRDADAEPEFPCVAESEVLISIINGLQVDNYLTIKVLNDNEVDGSSNWSNVNRMGIEGTAKLILQLLDGNLKTNASSKIDYWTFLE